MVSVSISAQNTFGDVCFVISQKVDFTDEERIFCMSNIMHVHTFIYSFIFLPARARAGPFCGFKRTVDEVLLKSRLETVRAGALRIQVAESGRGPSAAAC